MRLLKLLGALLGAAIAISILVPALASALPSFLDGTVAGLTFKGKSGASIGHAVGFTPDLKCKESTSAGEVTGEKTIEGKIAFEGCEEGGFVATSLGDAEKVVLFTFAGELCYINQANKEVGVYAKLPAAGIHVEVPGLKFLETYKGAFIGKAEFVNKLMALQDFSFKKPNIEECGGKKQTFLVEINAKAPVTAEIETFQELTFKGIEIMG